MKEMVKNTTAVKQLSIAKEESLINSSGFYIDGDVKVYGSIVFYRVGYKDKLGIGKTNMFIGGNKK